jgi:hypothetical protein
MEEVDYKALYEQERQRAAEERQRAAEVKAAPGGA